MVSILVESSTLPDGFCCASESENRAVSAVRASLAAIYTVPSRAADAMGRTTMSRMAQMA